jgi:hypothetical protein
MVLPMRALLWLGLVGYPPARVDHRFRLSRYPEQAADRERSLHVLRSLPADIWVTNHARAWGRYRKFVASATAKNPVDSFIDPEG